MFRKLTAIFAIIFMISIFTGCSNYKESQATDGNKIKVVVSFNALREFAEAVGGNKVDVTTMIPDGVEPHDFEPKPRDMEALNNANVFVYNGAGMEPWVNSALSNIDNEQMAVVDSSKGINLISTGQNQYDPHIWLSVKNAKTQAKNIEQALIKTDRADSSYYEKNYNNFAGQLDSLYNEYKVKFSTVKNKDFVTGHAAFAYLCRDFGLSQNSVEDVFAEGEPAPGELAKLVQYCKKNNVKSVFLEQLASPKVSETLANEVGAKTQKIYTLESREDNKNYIQSMQYNLENIYNSLK